MVSDCVDIRATMHSVRTCECIQYQYLVFVHCYQLLAIVAEVKVRKRQRAVLQVWYLWTQTHDTADVH